MNRDRIVLALCLLFCAVAFGLGINWGLPSRAADRFLFGEPLYTPDPPDPVIGDEKIVAIEPDAMSFDVAKLERRTMDANGTAPGVEEIQDVRFAELDADRPAARPSWLAAVAVLIDPAKHDVERHALADP